MGGPRACMTHWVLAAILQCDGTEEGFDVDGDGTVREARNRSEQNLALTEFRKA